MPAPPDRAAPKACTERGSPRASKYHITKSKKCTGSSRIQDPTRRVSYRQASEPGRKGKRNSEKAAKAGVPISPASINALILPYCAERRSSGQMGSVREV